MVNKIFWRNTHSKWVLYTFLRNITSSRNFLKPNNSNISKCLFCRQKFADSKPKKYLDQFFSISIPLGKTGICLMSQNGQTHFENLAVVAARFLKCA